MFFCKEKEVEECKACKVHEMHEKFLQEHIAKLVQEKDNERSEYKRTIDALLITKNLPAIGQGSQDNSKPFDPKELLGMLGEEYGREETEKKKE
jgi:hypothetical protein